MRVLVIDDDAGMRHIFAQWFSRRGWRIDVAGSISAAKKLLSSNEYDLAICDVVLPDGNGIALALDLAASEPSPRVLVMSGDPRNLEEARAAGLSECLSKPFGLDELMAMVRPGGGPQIARQRPAKSS